MQKSEQVVTLISGLMLGGGQRVVTDLLERAAQAPDLDLRLVLLGSREGTLAELADWIVDYDGKYNVPSTLLGTARRLRRHLLEKPCAILHTHGWDADFIGWLAILQMRTRQICHLHVTPDWLSSSHPRHRTKRWLTRRALARPGTRIIAVAEAVREYWRELLPNGSKQALVILNGVDVERYRPGAAGLSCADSPVIGLAARLAPSKGISYLLRALKLLADDGLKVSLKIAGEGALRSELEEMVRGLGLRENVTFLGNVVDMPKFYRSIDAFVLPSVSGEGLPLSILEAMATGLPVVATRIGGAAEVIRDGEHGFVVEPCDPVALSGPLRRLLTDWDLCKRLGGNARRRAVSELSLEHSAKSVFNVYRSMCQSA